MILRNQNKSQWCDYCKYQWGADHPRGQKPAVWLSKSESPKASVSFRYYCQECMVYLETWHDGSKWSMDDQQKYAMGLKEIDYGVELK